MITIEIENIKKLNNSTVKSLSVFLSDLMVDNCTSARAVFNNEILDVNDFAIPEWKELVNEINLEAK